MSSVQANQANQQQNELKETHIEEKPRQIVKLAKLQLDDMIVKIEQKIKQKLQINQDRFLYAYQNHLNRITKQLKLLKQHYDAQQAKFSTDKAIANLQKQCALFRQEAIRLSNQLQDALIQAEVYKRKSTILQKQIKDNDKRIQNLMRTTKQNQVHISKLLAESQKKQQTIKQLKQLINQEKIAQKNKVNNVGVDQKAMKIKQQIKHVKSQSGGDKLQNFIQAQMIQVLSGVKQQQTIQTKQHQYKIFGFQLLESSSKRNKTYSTFDCCKVGDRQTNRIISQTSKRIQTLTQNYDLQYLTKQIKNRIASAANNLKYSQNIGKQVKSKYINQFFCNTQDIQNFLQILFCTQQSIQKICSNQITMNINKKNQNVKGFRKKSLDKLRRLNFSSLWRQNQRKQLKNKPKFSSFERNNQKQLKIDTNLQKFQQKQKLDILIDHRIHSLKKRNSNMSECKNLGKFMKNSYYSARCNKKK